MQQGMKGIQALTFFRARRFFFNKCRQVFQGVTNTWHGMAELQAVSPSFSESGLQGIRSITGLVFGGSFEPIARSGSAEQCFQLLNFAF